MSCHDALRIDQFNEIFGGTQEKCSERVIRLKLQQKCWSEVASDPIAASNRCICWRYLFGLLSPGSKETWVAELNTSTVDYTSLKKDIFPSITNVGFDPLSDENPASLSYFERVEKVRTGNTHCIMHHRSKILEQIHCSR